MFKYCININGTGSKWAQRGKLLVESEARRKAYAK